MSYSIEKVVVGTMETNCYIVKDKTTGDAAVIDPGDNAIMIQDALHRMDAKMRVILLTHGHFDHVGAVKELAADTDCKVYIHEKDLSLPDPLTGGKLYYTDTYREGSHLHFPGLNIDVINTPGHTEGSVCLLVEDAMFSGDTLFANTCGRTDLPGGDEVAMTRSLWRLAALGKDYRVFPGHGRATSLSAERANNPYMK